MTPAAPPTVERIAARPSTLGGGLSIRRALPTQQRRTIGAWCFLDHIGPVTFAPETGMHIGSHPHIGLQTFTWMIEGEIQHRDSLGYEQVIRPGQVNLMTAGHGISHTEDTLPNALNMHAAQLWIALPASHADIAPSFEHHSQLPTWDANGCTFTLLAGQHAQQQAPGTFYTPLMGLEIFSEAGARLQLSVDPSFEHGLMPLEGGAIVEGAVLAMDELGYIAPGPNQLTLELSPGSRVLVLGGTPFETTPSIWWNFVSFDRSAITQALHDWEQATPRFGTVHDGEYRRLSAPELPWK